MDIPGGDVLAATRQGDFRAVLFVGPAPVGTDGLAPADINFSDATVRVTGKGSKTRVIPVGGHALRAVQTWLEARAPLGQSRRRGVVVNRNGTRLTPRGVQYRIKRWRCSSD